MSGLAPSPKIHGVGDEREATDCCATVTLAFLLGLLLTGALVGCSTSPADQEAIRKAWAERDAQRAAECARNGVGFAAGGCLGRGP